MSATVLMRRTLAGHLAPIDDLGREALSRIGQEPVLVTVKKSRNLGHHRKFFALLTLIYANQSRYHSVDELLDAMKVYLGHSQLIVLSDGREVHIPKSIAFHRMDQLEFNAFWDRAVTLVCEKILPGVNRNDLEREILDLVQ